MIKYQCATPYCNQLVDTKGDICSKCKAKGINPRAISKPYSKAIRSNEGLYNTTRWHRLSKEVISEHPYCSICGKTKDELKEERLYLTCHHTLEGELDEDTFFNSNILVVVCNMCHNKLTNAHVRDSNR